jgi:hypothetical protein
MGERKRDVPPGRLDWTLALAIAVALAILLPNLAKSGIWDPYELDAADLARRIAIHLFGAKGLEAGQSTSGMPTLSDLRMGDLPFSSMALGFKLFGLRDWSGRLPLAVWAFAGVLALYFFLARLVDRRAGLYGAIALSTMPLYFMQARTMLGDAVTMAALTLAFTGVAGASLDRGRARAAWGLIGVLGLVSGFSCRGVLLGVAAPLLAVGLGWMVLRLAGPERDDDPSDADAVGDGVAVAALCFGVVLAGYGIWRLTRASPDAPLARVLGIALLRKAPTEATFDLHVRQLGHALFPWSAFLPFAIGRLFRAPPLPAAHPGGSATIAVDARQHLARETAVRVYLLVGAAVFFAAYTFVAPYAGAIAFGAPALLAGIVALAVLDLERGAPASRTLALGCAVLGFVLYRDMVLVPDRALSVFSLEKPAFPKSFEPDAAKAMKVVAAAFVGLTVLGWFEQQPREVPRGRAWIVTRARQYSDTIRLLARTWNGNLVFSFIVVEAALVGLGAMLFVGQRFGWAAVDKLPKNFASLGLNAWWALPLIVALAGPVLFLIADGWRMLVQATRMPRAAATPLAAIFAGTLLAFWYYPALAAQVSPKEVFESYQRLHAPGEPLGLVGVRSRAAGYYGAGDVESFGEAHSAYVWLTEQMEQRRWLVVKADELPRLNSLYRKLGGKNLPVLDGHSSQIVLVSNQLGGATNQSWINEVVPDRPVLPGRPVDALFEDQLEVLGWEVLDRSGRPVQEVEPQTKYRVRFFYKVLRPITGAWKAFLHIDGHQRRYNGDHTVLDGKYPIPLWQPGDVIIDELEVQLEPNFTPGDYAVFFGFFAGETRYRVTRGSHHENRVNGGVLRVR